MVEQVISPERQEKKRLMKELKLKSGKQYRKWVKKERRLKKEFVNK